MRGRRAAAQGEDPRRRSSSRPSRSSGSSWSSAPRAGMFRRRRCWVTTPTVRTPGCAIGSTRPAASTCCRSGRRRRCSSRAPRSRCPPRSPARVARRVRPRPDRQPEPIGELIGRLGSEPRADGHVPRRTRRRAGHLHGSSSRACTPAHGWRESEGWTGWREGAEVPPREEWLIAEWPEDHDEPTDYWISNLPADTEPERLARLARHALEDGARLQAAQRRARPGPLRRPLLAWLVSPHRAGHRRPRVPHPRAAEPFSPAAGLTLPKAVLLLQPLFKCWTGRCRTCQRPHQRRPIDTHPRPPRRVRPNKALLTTDSGMPQNFIACDRGQSMLLPPDLTDWVPDDHVVWSILGAVEQMDLSAFYGAYRENGQGRAAYEPSMMVALLLVLVRAREPVLAGDRAGVPGGRGLQADHGDAGAGSLDDRGVPPPARAGARRVVLRGAGVVRGGGPGRGRGDLDRWDEDPRERVAGREPHLREAGRGHPQGGRGDRPLGGRAVRRRSR